jgi:hypothetical protein
VRLGFRRFIQPPQQQPLLEDAEPRGDSVVQSGFRFNRLHIFQCRNLGMAACRSCDGSVKIPRRKMTGREERGGSGQPLPARLNGSPLTEESMAYTTLRMYGGFPSPNDPRTGGGHPVLLKLTPAL